MVRYVSVDIETDGDVPGKYSMIQLGACFVDDTNTSFLINIAPISSEWKPEALRVSGFTREQTLEFTPALDAMRSFLSWLKKEAQRERLIFISDNAGFDWMFVCYYLWVFVEENPFGFSPGSITWLYKGYARTVHASFKHLRKRAHTHNALDDAIGNAEAFAEILRLMEDSYNESVQSGDRGSEARGKSATDVRNRERRKR